jgi:hypothetical protein
MRGAQSAAAPHDGDPILSSPAEAPPELGPPFTVKGAGPGTGVRLGILLTIETSINY